MAKTQPDQPGESTQFGRTLRHWRKVRRMSQLELALEADISTRHLSFIETGRAKPSREMVLRLSTALGLRLRQRNALLLAAEYRAEYPLSDLDHPKMAGVRSALEFILKSHEPFPAFVMDRQFTILMANSSMRNIFSLMLEPGVLEKYPNAYHLMFAEDGLYHNVTNWPEVASALLVRLYDELLLSQDELLQSLLDEILTYPNVPPDWQLRATQVEDEPILKFNTERDGKTLSFFATLTKFSTPYDVTLQELIVESLFPADETTRLLFRQSFDYTL
ncbi:MAG: helix-turn-helix transcriptional regulator [Anaerolineae bacterium]|nr:helix-turn-helix transcriptional regulator [Anaerolineae bacterium]